MYLKIPMPPNLVHNRSARWQKCHLKNDILHDITTFTQSPYYKCSVLKQENIFRWLDIEFLKIIKTQISST